jgi:hypothetical protein
MEIVQISIPDIPELKGLFVKAGEVPDVEMSGIIDFIKENWFWILVGAVVLVFLFFVFSPSKKVENDKPNGVSQATPFNQPITYIQRPNGNVGQ